MFTWFCIVGPYLFLVCVFRLSLYLDCAGVCEAAAFC